MEDAKKKEAMSVKRPRMLDLNAPLLSARRLGLSGGKDISHTDSQGESMKYTRNRIPFSWEQEPGRPKVIQDQETHGMKKSSKETTNDDDFKKSGSTLSHPDDGFDGDVEDGTAFSGAFDMHSLSEAIDYVERASKVQKLDRHKLESLECSRKDYKSRNFMMQRFLPDATALAESSTLSHHLSKVPYLCKYPQGCMSHSSISKPLSSPKLCGIRTMFPWWIKPQVICGVKFPSPSVQIEAPARPVKHVAVKRPFTCPDKDI